MLQNLLRLLNFLNKDTYIIKTYLSMKTNEKVIMMKLLIRIDTNLS